MKLRTWREREKLTLQQLSDRLGGTKSKSAIARIETGVSDPDAAFIRAVFDLTGGAVTANDFYDLASADRAIPHPQAEAAPAGEDQAMVNGAPAGASSTRADDGRPAPAGAPDPEEGRAA